MSIRDSLALDRASVRSYDADGRLRVAQANISKANVCPYLGREIPDWQALGLDPDKTYQLYRHPEELAKAAPTFAGVPLLSEHTPVSADSHQPGKVVGSIGTDAEFVAPYLRASLIVWAADAIRDVEAEVKKQLSSGYRYRADMTPGEVDGEKYDGVMRDIIGNHVALVSEGRAGPDVVIGDSAFTPKENDMAAHAKGLSRAALFASGALHAYLRPKLAQDAKIDIAAALDGVTAKNFSSKKPAIAAALKDGVKGKLAQDADIEDVAALLDALEEAAPADGTDELAPNAGVPGVRDPKTMDADPFERVKAFLKGKLSDEDRQKVDEMLDAEPRASDESEEEKRKREEEERREKEARDKAARDEEMKDMVTKPAMDAAIAAAVKAAEDRAAQNQREIRNAERAVRPYVGDLAMAHDSADGVYRTALTMLGVKVDGIHASAFPALLAAQPVPGAKPKVAVAMDAAGAKGFADRFPEAARINLI